MDAGGQRGPQQILPVRHLDRNLVWLERDAFTQDSILIGDEMSWPRGYREPAAFYHKDTAKKNGKLSGEVGYGRRPDRPGRDLGRGLGGLVTATGPRQGTGPQGFNLKIQPLNKKHPSPGAGNLLPVAA